MTARISLALVIHNHQPVGNFGWVFEDVYRQAYEPFVGALERHPGVRMGLHYTGPLLEWLADAHPEFLDRVRVLSDHGQVEILGGGLYEPILVSLPERDRHAQLTSMASTVERLFGSRPRGAWLAERVWEPSLPTDLVDAGYEWTVLDDNHLRGASVAEDAMWGAYTTDDQGRRLTVFGTEQGLRYRIPFGDVDDLIAYLRGHATEDGRRVGMMGDDGEKFGAWPGTYEHCWGGGAWIDRCFSALEANADWLTTVTPSGWLSREPPIGRIYVPTASYVEMTQWALPADEANTFGQLLHDAREHDRPEARFLRGATWRNFQARYREINDLHKQMLRVSERVAALDDGPERATAVEHLHRGQSNDCYWHGLFGGIYIVHMRLATLAHLIAAEDAVDRATKSLSQIALADVDLDGVDEVLVATPGQVIAVDAAEGAGISSWDLRASRLALASVLRRRPEAYHQTLLDFERSGKEADAPTDESGTPKTIHDIVMVKEQGLGARLHYDRFERRSGLVRLMPRGTEPPAIVADAYDELGDFAGGAFEVVSLDGDGVRLRRAGKVRIDGIERPLEVEKRIVAGGGRLDPSLSLEVAVANPGAARVEADLAIEWNACLAGGGGNPSAFYEREGPDGPVRSAHDGSGDLPAATGLAFGNDYEGVRVEAAVEPAARLAWYPVETVSNSEAGFERVYQGSCLLVRWPLVLDPGERAVFRLRFDVRQAVDRAEAAEPAADAVGALEPAVVDGSPLG